MSSTITIGLIAGVTNSKHADMLRGCCDTWIKDCPNNIYVFNGQDGIEISNDIEKKNPKTKMVHLPLVGDDYSSFSFKQYLGLAHMYQNTQSEWYGILGIDNYVHFDRLQRILDRFDSSISLIVGGPMNVARKDLYYTTLIGGGGIFFSRMALTKLFNDGPKVDNSILESYRKHYDEISINSLMLRFNWKLRESAIGGPLSDACDFSICYFGWMLKIPMVSISELFPHDYANCLEDGRSLGTRMFVPDEVAIVNYLDRGKMQIYRALSRKMNNAEIAINMRYKEAVGCPSDINQHLPILHKYASECTKITACGLRNVDALFAFLDGLRLTSKTEDRTIYGVDLHASSEIYSLIDLAHEAGIKIDYIKDKSTTVEIPTNVDLLFIDTFHVYGHMKRELEHHHKNVNMYIVMHDTEVDGERGEALRQGFNITSLSKSYGYPEEEISLGIRPAIIEFLKNHPEWVICYEVTYNNGLTIFRRTKS